MSTTGLPFRPDSFTVALPVTSFTVKSGAVSPNFKSPWRGLGRSSAARPLLKANRNTAAAVNKRLFIRIRNTFRSIFPKMDQRLLASIICWLMQVALWMNQSEIESVPNYSASHLTEQILAVGESAAEVQEEATFASAYRNY